MRWSWTIFSRSKVKVIAELYENLCLEQISIWSNLTHTLLTECLWSKGVHSLWMKFAGQLSRSYQIIQKSFNFKSIYAFHLDLFGSYFTWTKLSSRGCAMTLNQVSRSNVKVIVELYKQSLSGAYLLSICSNLTLNLPTWSLW